MEKAGEEKTGTLTRPDGNTIAWMREVPGKAAGPTGLVWFGGFKSDMTGTKAQAVAAWARRAQRDLTRFDYFAHGASSGDFTDGTITRWRDDAWAVIDELTTGPLVLIGSSMGGWISLLAALSRPERVKALLLIAPAPDFTEELMWKGFTPEIRETIMREGVYEEPSDYDPEPYRITRQLIEDGRRHLLLGDKIPLTFPVRILQGMKDPDVPYAHALRLVDALASDDVILHLKKDGDHRLSEPDDIATLTTALEKLLADLEKS